ncbi:MAG: SprB repeat-containing protein [Flavobacteriales bacterium]|nr:SprB repeat-containing protein [Flavobacteriales bacterium]
MHRSAIRALLISIFLLPALHASATTYYFKYVNGNWASNLNWALVSGGSTGHGPPTQYDDVVFDENSQLGPGLQVNTNGGVCHDLRVMATAPSFQFLNIGGQYCSGSLTIHGDLDIQRPVTIVDGSSYCQLTMIPSNGDQTTIRTSGTVLEKGIYIGNYNGPTIDADVWLQDDLTGSALLIGAGIRFHAQGNSISGSQPVGGTGNIIQVGIGAELDAQGSDIHGPMSLYLKRSKAWLDQATLHGTLITLEGTAEIYFGSAFLLADGSGTWPTLTIYYESLSLDNHCKVHMGSATGIIGSLTVYNNGTGNSTCMIDLGTSVIDYRGINLSGGPCPNASFNDGISTIRLIPMSSGQNGFQNNMFVDLEVDRVVVASGISTIFNLTGVHSAELVFEAGADIIVPFGQSWVTDLLISEGTTTLPINVRCLNSSLGWSLGIPNGQTCIDHATLQNVRVSGQGPFYAGANSVDNGGNTNWIFAACAACAPVSLTVTGSDVSCFAAADGHVTTAASSPNAPLTYAWNTGATTDSIGGLGPGMYYVTAYDAVGCWKRDTVFLTEPDAILLTLDTVLPSCGQADGQVLATVNRDPLSTQYNWSNGATTEDLPAVGQGTYTLTLTDADGCAATATAVLVDSTCFGALNVKVFLEGAYVTSTGTMRDDLRANALVPITDPYPAMGLYTSPAPHVAVLDPAVLAVTGDDAIVDWVRLELRDPLDPSVIKAAKHVLVQRDGDVVDLDGVSPVGFFGSVGTHHVVVRHRNHLACMTLDPVAMTSAPVSVDLTDAATTTFGTNARKSITGTFPALVLWAGDVTFNGQVKYAGGSNDRDPILVRIGGLVPTATANGYYPEDVNLNGQVKYAGSANDRDPILVNIGGTVPTAVRNAQLP